MGKGITPARAGTENLTDRKERRPSSFEEKTHSILYRLRDGPQPGDRRCSDVPPRSSGPCSGVYPGGAAGRDLLRGHVAACRP